MTLSAISEPQARELLRAARAAARDAYAPYSDFKVGAALLAVDGQIFTGVNIENAAYSATLCAERGAIAKAVSEGQRDFQAVAIVAADGSDISPCGTCRQVLREFGVKAGVVTEDGAGQIRVESLSELLPRAFKL